MRNTKLSKEIAALISKHGARKVGLTFLELCGRGEARARSQTATVIAMPGKLTRRDASAYLLRRHGISRTPSYLAFLASQGGGPVYRKINGSRVVYDAADLDTWAASMISAPGASASEIG